MLREVVISKDASLTRERDAFLRRSLSDAVPCFFTDNSFPCLFCALVYITIDLSILFYIGSLFHYRSFLSCTWPLVIGVLLFSWTFLHLLFITLLHHLYKSCFPFFVVSSPFLSFPSPCDRWPSLFHFLLNCFLCEVLAYIFAVSSVFPLHVWFSLTLLFILYPCIYSSAFLLHLFSPSTSHSERDGVIPPAEDASKQRHSDVAKERRRVSVCFSRKREKCQGITNDGELFFFFDATPTHAVFVTCSPTR